MYTASVYQIGRTFRDKGDKEWHMWAVKSMDKPINFETLLFD